MLLLRTVAGLDPAGRFGFGGRHKHALTGAQVYLGGVVTSTAREMVELAAAAADISLDAGRAVRANIAAADWGRWGLRGSRHDGLSGCDCGRSGRGGLNDGRECGGRLAGWCGGGW